jgi:hypothetical protein
MIRRGKHDRLSVRRPCRAERVAPEPGERRQLRSRQHRARFPVARRGPRRAVWARWGGCRGPRRAVRARWSGHVDDPQMGLRLVEPAIEIPDGKRLVDTDLRFGVALVLRGLAVRLFVRRALPHRGLKRDPRPVRTPYRCARGRRRVRDAVGVAAERHVEHVNLRNLVVVALGRERQTGTVAAPRGSAFSRLVRREPARLRTAVRRHDPQVGHFLRRIVGRLSDGEDDPLAVR